MRHEALRTRFVEHDGLPRQLIDPAPTEFLLPARTRPDHRSMGGRAVPAPFDLAAGPLFRAALARLGHDDHALVLVVHHIVADGWSAKILAEELSLLYAAGTTGGDQRRSHPAAPLQPADHAAWQRSWLDAAETERQLDYWRQNLPGWPPSTSPPTAPDRPNRPAPAQ